MTVGLLQLVTLVHHKLNNNQSSLLVKTVIHQCELLIHNIYHMSREIRPSTGKARPNKRHTTPSYEDQRGVQNQIKDPSKFKERFEAIRSARERKPLPTPPLINIDTKEPLQGSHSKFLQRFNSIRCLRQSLQESKTTQAEEKKREEFESNRKRIFLEDKLSTLSSYDSLLTPKGSIAQKTALKRVGRTPRKPAEGPPSRPNSAGIEFVSLNKISSDELIIRLEDSVEKQQGQVKQGKHLTGYWKTENHFVSLIPLERNEKVSFNHPHILSIYAEVTINEKRYVLSDQYKNCSLRNLLEEFGPFQQALGRRYLRQIAVGLQHMHYYRRAHNRLGLSSILYNQNGKLFINAVKATSFVPSRQELTSGKQLHSFAPEFLLSKGFSKSLKNDVWALGCLAILMLTSTGLAKSPFHPYAMKKLKSQEEEQMLDNVRQLYPTCFREAYPQERIYKNSQGQRKLSDAAKNFIQCCLQPLADERPTIEALLQHEFFEGFDN